MTNTPTLRPLGLMRAERAPEGALRLAGGWRAFFLCEVVLRENGKPNYRETLQAEQLLSGAHSALAPHLGALNEIVSRLTAPRTSWAGFALDRPLVMGIVNVTPDSFSDGGDRFDAGRAVADGRAMVEAGADILDVGGESTRPGADEVSEEEEMRRVLPVVRTLAAEGAKVSIDTRHARVMIAALEAGATIINDVTALAGDKASLGVVADSGAAAVLMHMQGEPHSMQQNPIYGDAPLDIYDYLEGRIEVCEKAGIPRARLAIDPGIGFGKNVQHNLQILENLTIYHGLGCPVLLGASRKSFIGRLSRGEVPKARLPGSLAAALYALQQGVQILRVHDVAETRQALTLWQAIEAAGSE